MSSTRTIFLLTLVGASVIFAQGDDVASRQRDLDRLRGAIRGSEDRLRQLEGEAKRSQSAMREVRAQAVALDTLIEALRMREQTIAEEMIAVQRYRDSLGRDLSLLRGEYASMARALFKNRLLASGASMLLLPKEHQKLALRQRLFERYARQQRERAGRIAGMGAALAEQDSILRGRQGEQLAVMEEKRGEMARLIRLQREHAEALGKNSRERDALRAAIEERNAEANTIAAMIAKMGEVRADGGSRSTAESSRSNPRTTEAQEREKKRRRSEKSDGGRSQTSSRSRGLRFIWPTSGRRIVEGYGERKNPETGTVTINPGINIAATRGSAVVAAEAGTVSLVSWLPSYGTIVIVEHRDGYRTVYGNLARATVSRGARVAAGERIGSVGGDFVHFEVWKGQTRLNPANVLK